ncbi:uncharacterized protein [Osmerus mordax]|uniref:uncharacterized protein n=1 Tax=Osmerus mordax TaxID=8014 RepID=UPI00350F2374
MSSSKPSSEEVTYGEATGETESFVSVAPGRDQETSQEIHGNPDAEPTASPPHISTHDPADVTAPHQTTMGTHLTESSGLERTTMVDLTTHRDHTTVSSASEHVTSSHASGTPMTTPIPSIIYQGITDQQVVIINSTSSQAPSDLTDHTPTMVLHGTKPSTGTAIIFTEEAKNEEELFSTVTSTVREGSLAPEIIAKDDIIIDADAVSVVPSSQLDPTVMTEEATGIQAVTMTPQTLFPVTDELEGSGIDDGVSSTPETIEFWINEQIYRSDRSFRDNKINHPTNGGSFQ